MSQRINHRRKGRRHQDNGPRYENANPMAGCNSTHVARSRSAWRKMGRRALRRTGKHTGVHYEVGGGQAFPTIEDELQAEGE